MTKAQLTALQLARAALLAALLADPTRPARHAHEDLTEAALPLDALAEAVAAYLEARPLGAKGAAEVKALREE